MNTTSYQISFESKKIVVNFNYEHIILFIIFLEVMIQMNENRIKFKSYHHQILCSDETKE